MRNFFLFLTQNQILNVSFAAWFIAQVLKMLIILITERRLDWKRLTGSGGMPSSHSAFVVACAAAIGRQCGIGSVDFAISAVLAAIVMYDASHVRRAAGEQAKILNYMMGHWMDATPELFGQQLKELLGHTPLQVFFGALLGLGIGLAA